MMTVTVPRCGGPVLPCGYTRPTQGGPLLPKPDVAEHVCGLAEGHACCCSPCRCAVCSDACPACGSIDVKVRYVIVCVGCRREGCWRTHPCHNDEFHGTAA